MGKPIPFTQGDIEAAACSAIRRLCDLEESRPTVNLKADSEVITDKGLLVFSVTLDRSKKR